ncbi:hypothetical protein FACS189437_01310 [Bacteroidia bacterium]|nr:hypothetical protein FACS189437_01310 [Bacteroidia bacterium]
MRKKLFFLIVFGLVLSFATKAQVTTQLIKVSVDVADKTYDGTTDIDPLTITPTFTDAVGQPLGSAPSYVIETAVLVGNKNAEVVDKDVNVTIKLTDPTEGFAFQAGTVADAYVTTVTGKVTIQQALLTVTSATVNDKPYDGTTNGTLKAIVFNGLQGTDKVSDVSYTTKVTFSSPDAGASVPADVEVTLATAGNYYLNPNPTIASTTAAITQAKLTIASIAFASTTKVYDGAPLTVTGVTFNATPAITPAPVLGVDYTVDTSLLPVNAGVYTGNVLENIILTWSGSPNYTLAAADNKVTLGAYSISKATLTVTALPLTKTYDGTTTLFDTDLSTSGTGFTVSPAIAVTGSLSWAKNKNVGIYKATIGTLASTDNNYYVDQFVTADLEITKLTVAITTDPATTAITYGTATPALTPVFTPALPAGDTYTGTLKVYLADGTTLVTPQSPLNTGSYKIGKTGDISLNTTNYTISGFTAGDLTVTSSNVLTITPATGQFKTYGEPDPAFAYTITGFVAPDTEASIKALLTGNLSYAGTATPVAKSDAGTYDFTLGDLDFKTANPNYTLTIASPAVPFEIRKANVIVTPKELSNQLGQAQTIFAYEDVFDVALLNGDDAATVFASLTITRNGAKNSATATPLATDSVGSYDYQIGTLATLTNYNLILTSVTPLAQYKIVPAVVYVLPTPDQGKGFGEADPALTYTVVNSSDALITPAVTLTGNLQRAAGENVGSYAYNVTGLTNPNYTVQLSTTADKFTISKGVIEVDVKDTTGVYGSAATTLDATYYVVKPAGLPAGTLTGAVVRTGEGNLASVAPKATDPVGDYDILQGTLAVADPNYSLVFHAGTYTITPKALKVTPVAGQSKEYGNDDPVFTYTVEGLVGNDKAADVFTGALDRISGYNVGTYPIINGLQIDSLTLVQPSNYSYNSATDFTAGVTFAITPATLTVYPKAASKTYGQTDTQATPAVFATITVANRSVVLDSIKGWKLGAATGLNVDDDSKLTGNLAREAGNDAGKYNYLATSLTVPNNYTVVIGGTKQFTINPKGIVVTPIDTFKYFGQADPTIRFTATGLVSPDKITDFIGHLTRVAGENVGTYAINNVGSDSLQAKNYTLTIATGKVLEIRKGTLTEDDLTIDSPAPVYYDGNPYGVSVSVNGIDARAISVKYLDENGREIPGSPINAGSYTVVVTITATDNNNLSVITLTDPFVISKAEVQVTPNAGQSKVVGETNPVYTYTSVYVNPAPSTPNLIGVPFDGALTRDAGETVGTYLIKKGTLNAGNNYTLFVDETVVFTITAGAGPIVPDTVTVTATALSKVYGENDPELTYTAVPADVTFTGELVRANGENAGTYAIKQGTLSAANYVIKYVGADFTINKADQEITFPTLSTVKTGDVPFALGASVNTGLPLTYTSGTTTVATVNGAGTVTILKVGTTTITVSQAGNNNYNPATASQVLTVESGVGIHNIVAEGQVSIYPSVAQRNSTITLDANVNVKNAALSVYNVNGQLISVTPVVNTVTTLSAPSTSGAYIYVFKAEGINKTMRVLVK